jgi:hypothetical protein
MYVRSTRYAVPRLQYGAATGFLSRRLEHYRDGRAVHCQNDLAETCRRRLELVRDELDRYCAEFDKAIEEMRINDPDRFAQNSRRAEAYLNTFRSDGDKPKN